MSLTPDEETPLLTEQPQSRPIQQSDSQKQRTPLPWRQLSILLLLQISEPITALVIAPFLPQLIRDIGVTDGKDSRVGYYVGLMHSLFFLTEACTIFHWSRLSDRIGRKPVVLIGLFGLSLSMWSFGLSQTFWSLVISRCLSGALNGNIGVMKSMIVEMTDPTNIAQAFSILPITWALGMTVGPLIGGSLAEPVVRFPKIFGRSEFLKQYPYFLPCSVAATVSAFSWLITLAFLKETTKPQMSLRQYLFGGTKKGNNVNSDPRANATSHDGVITEAGDQQLTFRALLIRPVLVAAGSYATFSLIDIAFRTVLPVYYAMPIDMGGLNLDPPAIGTILAIYGISSGIMQWMFFAPMYDWLGAKTMYLVVVSLCFPVIALFPTTSIVARVYGIGYLVWFLVGLQMLLLVFTVFAFAITIMCIGAAAPNKESIGATNGLAQIMVSVMRAVGPAIVNSTYSLSIEKNIMGGYLAYLVMAAMVGLTLWSGYLLPKRLWNE